MKLILKEPCILCLISPWKLDEGFLVTLNFKPLFPNTDKLFWEIAVYKKLLVNSGLFIVISPIFNDCVTWTLGFSMGIGVSNSKVKKLGIIVLSNLVVW